MSRPSSSPSRASSSSPSHELGHAPSAPPQLDSNQESESVNPVPLNSSSAPPGTLSNSCSASSSRTASKCSNHDKNQSEELDHLNHEQYTNSFSSSPDMLELYSSSENSSKNNSRPSSSPLPHDIHNVQPDQDVLNPVPLRPGTVDLIPIYVETLTGVTFEMQVLPRDSILNVKNKLEVAEGISSVKQHLLWQGQELRDDFTLEEYNIGFGAILKLVLGLKGGPTVATPPFELSTQFTNYDRDEDEERPLTVLIFQDGETIKFLTISTATSNSTVATSIVDPFDTESANCGRDQEGDELIKAPATARRMVSAEKRIKDNLRLKSKVEDLQERMRKLNLRKRKKVNCDLVNQNQEKAIKVPTRLPAISNQMNANQNKSSSKAVVHFPPIVKGSKNSKFEASSKWEKSSKNPAIEDEQTTIKRTEDKQTDDTQEAIDTIDQEQVLELDLESLEFDKLRSKSLSYVNKFASQLRNRIKNRRSHQLVARLSSDDSVLRTGFANCDSELDPTSSVGSVAMTKSQLTKRPNTSPLIGDINPQLMTIREFRELKTTIQKSQLTNSISNSKSSRTGLKSGSLLNRRKMKNSETKSVNPVTTIKNPIKVRCSACRRKLQLANQFNCRCNLVFCSNHRYAEAHNCSFDYRAEGRRLIKMNNPLIKAPKLPKI